MALIGLHPAPSWGISRASAAQALPQALDAGVFSTYTPAMNSDGGDSPALSF